LTLPKGHGYDPVNSMSGDRTNLRIGSAGFPPIARQATEVQG
jgi:hypothetical protein